MSEIIRIAGAIIIAGCGATMGFAAGGQMRKRVESLSGLTFALENIRTEMLYARTPLPEIIKKLGKCGKSDLCAVFRDMSDKFILSSDSFQHTWSAGFRQHAETLCLEREELEILLDLGFTIGRYDLEGEDRALKLAIRRLERSLSAAREKAKRDGRLCRTLGIGSGLAAAIILL